MFIMSTYIQESLAGVVMFNNCLSCIKHWTIFVYAGCEIALVTMEHNNK